MNLNRGFGITQFYHGAPYPDGDGGYVAIDPTDPSILYVESQRFGFRRSSDGGFTFEAAVDGVTEWLALGSDDQDNPLLFAFTHGRGAWKVTLNPVPPAPREPAGRRRP